jgi:hypothetical protein
VVEAARLISYLFPVLVGGNVVVFAGAGLSGPSTVETASQLAARILAGGFQSPSTTTELEDLAEQSCRIARNDLGVATCSHCSPDFRQFENLLPDWSTKRPNEAHLFVARLAKEKCITYIVTVNWDDLVELGLRYVGQPHQVYVTGEEAKPVRAGEQTVVFKLNGSRSVPRTLVACRQQLRRREWALKWRELVLQEAIRNRHVLFIGYSGCVCSVTETVRELGDMGLLGKSFVVDKLPLSKVVPGSWQREFLDTIGADAESYFEGDSVELCEALFLELHAHLVKQII